MKAKMKEALLPGEGWFGGGVCPMGASCPGAEPVSPWLVPCPWPQGAAGSDLESRGHGLASAGIPALVKSNLAADSWHFFTKYSASVPAFDSD